MSQPTVQIIADSISPDGVRLTTFRLSYWRSIHAEVMTHREFSRNASSSRAIPILRMLRQVWSKPAGPRFWGTNKPGMQAGVELTGWRKGVSKFVWNLAAKSAASFSWMLMKLGNHKQLANRVTEPYQFISVVVTSTSYANFFILRDHGAAQPEIQDLAVDMKKALLTSRPQQLAEGEWHLPFVTGDEVATHVGTPTEWLLPVMSAARAARASYNNFDGSKADAAKDLALFEKLVIDRPAHASPTEHQAKVDSGVFRSRNFQGDWKQFREILELDGWGPYEAVGDTSTGGISA